MDSWMNDERRDITRKYVHDMINSFVDNPEGTNYHNEYIHPYIDIYAPSIASLIEQTCHVDKYLIKHPKFNVLHEYDDVLYDIEGHRVGLDPERKIVTIYVDGVAFDEVKYDELMRPYKYWVTLPAKEGGRNLGRQSLPKVK